MELWLLPIHRTTLSLDKELWKEFIVYAKIRSTSGSKLLRNAIRKILEKTENEMEAIE